MQSQTKNARQAATWRAAKTESKAEQPSFPTSAAFEQALRRLTLRHGVRPSLAETIAEAAGLGGAA